jgi:citrate lyase subunit alpha/citrate CoA-transferase
VLESSNNQEEKMKKNLIVNKVGREIPDYIEGYGEVQGYKGPFATKPTGVKSTPLKSYSIPGTNKIVENLKTVIEKVNFKDGMTISFHHHLDATQDQLMLKWLTFHQTD